MSANQRTTSSMGRLARLIASPSTAERRLLVAFFAIVGFLVPALYGFSNGFPEPHYHDEFGYLLSGDTFAHGRLANPTPEYWEHFEAPQALIRPTYASRYPPGQGLFLALGQVTFGHPAFGVWISCGFAAASLFWMLLAWTKPSWAALGAVLLILLAGTDYYWAQSYWGGMVAFSGGALFFGGFRRIIAERQLAGSAFWTALGGVILLNSRPFEGTMTMVPACLVVLWFLIRRTKTPSLTKFARVAVPAAIVAASAFSMMGLNNYRVTGTPLRFPYTEHQKQYFSAPLFIFQSPTEPDGAVTERHRKLYASLDRSDLLRWLDDYMLPDVKPLFPVYAFGYMVLNITYGLLYPPLMLLFFAGLPVLVAKSRWMRFVLISTVFTLACISFATYWDFTHYIAPLGPFVYLLAVQVVRVFWHSAVKQGRCNAVAAMLVLVVGTSVAYQKFYPYEWIFSVVQRVQHQSFDGVNLDLSRPSKIKIERTATQIRRLVEETAAKGDRKYLMVVKYSPNFTWLDEVVFNKADLNEAKVVWTTAIDEESDRALVASRPDRIPLRVSITGENFTIEPY